MNPRVFFFFVLRGINWGLGFLLCWALFLSLFSRFEEGPLTPMKINGIGINRVEQYYAFLHIPVQNWLLYGLAMVPFCLGYSLWLGRKYPAEGKAKSLKVPGTVCVVLLIWILILLSFKLSSHTYAAY